MKESVVSECASSRCTTLEERHVNMHPYLFSTERPALTFSGPKKSTPTLVNGGLSGVVCSLRSDAIFWWPNFPLYRQQTKHFPIVFFNVLGPWMIPYDPMSRGSDE
ncbi:hypothetical protein DPMN_146291 [Dreissena polymorpha]|uniref:Uncharacterized protein n=1 Tax=Dreissena polymorpha TaxID=45954 RepID=A0A9D4F6R9_DREPO|nr:hypothetical protein DPMN_146291 [Dreissena polymorpha]